MNGTIRLQEVIERVLGPLKEFLLSPETIEGVVRKFELDLARVRKSSSQNQHKLERDRAANERKIKSVVNAIEVSPDSRALVGRLRELEAEAEEIERQARILRANAPVVIHPNASGGYRQKN